MSGKILSLRLVFLKIRNYTSVLIAQRLIPQLIQFRQCYISRSSEDFVALHVLSMSVLICSHFQVHPAGLEKIVELIGRFYHIKPAFDVWVHVADHLYYVSS